MFNQYNSGNDGRMIYFRENSSVSTTESYKVSSSDFRSLAF